MNGQISGRPALKTRAVALLIAFAGILGADQIQLKDGDRITGVIVRKEAGKLTVKSKNFGVVTVNWDDVESIRSDQPLTVVLRDDRTVQASIQTVEGQIRIGQSEPPNLVALNEILALRDRESERDYQKLLRPGLLDLWVITGSLNIAGARGNAGTSTITTPVNLVRSSRTSKTSAYFNAIRSTALVDGVSAQTAKAIRGGWSFSRNLSKRALVNTFNDYEYDKFQSLDLRTVVGGGAGYQAWKGEQGDLSFVGGGAWNRESFTPHDGAGFSRHAFEAYWGDDLHFRLNSRTSLVHGFRLFHNLTEAGEFRMNFDAGATVFINKWMTWNVSLADRYLSNPVNGRKSNDLLYTTGLGFTFGR